MLGVLSPLLVCLLQGGVECVVITAGVSFLQGGVGCVVTTAGVSLAGVCWVCCHHCWCVSCREVLGVLSPLLV